MGAGVGGRRAAARRADLYVFCDELLLEKKARLDRDDGLAGDLPTQRADERRHALHLLSLTTLLSASSQILDPTTLSRLCQENV